MVDTADIQREFLEWALLGDEQAIDFCERLGEISQVWDDLVDEPGSVDDRALAKTFWLALCVLPNHPFYREHSTHLSAVIEVAILDYIASVSLERGDPHAKSLAFVIRDTLAVVVVYCARVLGGFDWAAEIAAKVRLSVHDELLQEYLEGLEA